MQRCARFLTIALLSLASCTTLWLRYQARPPRRWLTIEKAQRWIHRHATPDQRNGRYYRAYPK